MAFLIDHPPLESPPEDTALIEFEQQAMDLVLLCEKLAGEVGAKIASLTARRSDKWGRVIVSRLTQRQDQELAESALIIWMREDSSTPEVHWTFEEVHPNG